MKTVIVSHTKFNGELEIQFDPGGVLYQVLNRTGMDNDLLHRFFGLIPVHQDELKTWQAQHGFMVNEVPLDLSFDAWWAHWCANGGIAIDKKESLAAWKKMTIVDKTKAWWQAIAYGLYMARNKHWYSCKSPQGWLKQKRYERDYNTL